MLPGMRRISTLAKAGLVLAAVGATAVGATFVAINHTSTPVASHQVTSTVARSEGSTASAPAPRPTPTSHASSLPASANSGANMSFFFVPHQDDDVISMGLAIAQATRAHRQVYVVEVTDGAQTQALAKINYRINLIDQRQPKKRLVPLTHATLAAARNREQRAALETLGVPASHIVVESQVGHPGTAAQPYFTVDEPSYREFVRLLTSYVNRYPKASFNTMSWLDLHPDHYHLGYALDSLCVSRKLTCRFYQSEAYQMGATDFTVSLNVPWISKHAKTPIPKVVTPSGTYLREASLDPVLLKAIGQYEDLDPTAGRYAVAKFSVGKQLAYAALVKRDWVHLDSHHWTSTKEKAAAATWIAAYQRPDLAH